MLYRLNSNKTLGLLPYMTSLAVGALVLSGCGGSSSSSSSGKDVGGMGTMAATMPDGSPMVLEVAETDADEFAGSYSVFSNTGPHSFESGACFGSVANRVIDTVCIDTDGHSFKMSGKAVSGGYDFKRDDIASATLAFRATAAALRSGHRADRTFKLSTQVGTGVVTINGDETFNANGEYMLRGQFNGRPVTVVAYSDGKMKLKVEMSHSSVLDMTFNDMTPSQLGEATRSPDSAVILTVVKNNASCLTANGLSVGPP